MKTEKIKVGLVNINNSFAGYNYFPYSIGCLQAYATKYYKRLERFTFLLPIYKRVTVKEAVQSLCGADVVFYSTYVWNMQLSLAIARELKKINPKILNIFGGPQVPDRIEGFLAENRFVDVACHGEGERVFMHLLDACIDQNWSDVPSISYIDSASQKMLQTPRAKRIEDLAEAPSPYLDGTFESLMKTYPEEGWVALWETNRGCPFSCTFCDWGSAVASKVYRFSMERVLAEADWFSKEKIDFIYCCDANFGLLPRDYDIVVRVAHNKSEFGYPKALSVQNTKNSSEKSYRIQKVLGDSGLNKGVTLSMQSLDEKTLEAIRRDNIKTDTYRELQMKFTADKIETYSDIILGLPGETYSSFIDGVNELLESGQHNRIQFNNLSILPNSEMGDPEYQKKYGMIIRNSDIINTHGSLTDLEEVIERQELVVGTNTMPPEDWVKVRCYSWLVSLIHFDKLLSMPIIIIHFLTSLSYRDIVHAFVNDRPDTPLFNEIRAFFVAKALDIQNGGSEYCESKEWLNIWWPADEHAFIKICSEDKLEQFYLEAKKIFQTMLKDKFLNIPDDLLSELLTLNHGLIRLPFQKENKVVKLKYNIVEAYEAGLKNIFLPVTEGEFNYEILRTAETYGSWKDWFREVVWYGNKKGAYIYKYREMSPVPERDSLITSPSSENPPRSVISC